MPHRTPRAAGLIAVILFAATTAGCNHYRVTDPATGEHYYTTKLKTYKGSGSTMFKDAVTGDQVTLTGHRVRKVKAAEWKAAVHAAGEAPAAE